jgi:hypothetical protein
MASHTWIHPLQGQIEEALREGSEARVEDAVSSFLGELNVYVVSLDLSQRRNSTFEVTLFTYEPVKEEVCEQLHLFTEMLQEVSGRAARVQLLTVTEQFFSRDFQFAETA